MAHLMIITYLQSEKTLHVDVKERAKNDRIHSL
jgi:hypothetical protein